MSTQRPHQRDREELWRYLHLARARMENSGLDRQYPTEYRTIIHFIDDLNDVPGQMHIQPTHIDQQDNDVLELIGEVADTPHDIQNEADARNTTPE